MYKKQPGQYKPQYGQQVYYTPPEINTDQVNKFFLLIQEGKIIDAKIFASTNNISYNSVDSEKNTLLHSILTSSLNKKEKLKIARFVIDNGTDINQANKYNIYPLHYAAQFHLSDIAKLLIERGATVNCIDSKNKTPLHYACMMSKTICPVIPKESKIKIKADIKINEMKLFEIIYEKIKENTVVQKYFEHIYNSIDVNLFTNIKKKILAEIEQIQQNYPQDQKTKLITEKIKTFIGYFMTELNDGLEPLNINVINGAYLGIFDYENIEKLIERIITNISEKTINENIELVNTAIENFIQSLGSLDTIVSNLDTLISDNQELSELLPIITEYNYILPFTFSTSDLWDNPDRRSNIFYYKYIAYRRIIDQYKENIDNNLSSITGNFETIYHQVGNMIFYLLLCLDTVKLINIATRDIKESINNLNRNIQDKLTENPFKMIYKGDVRKDIEGYISDNSNITDVIKTLDQSKKDRPSVITIEKIISGDISFSDKLNEQTRLSYIERLISLGIANTGYSLNHFYNPLHNVKNGIQTLPLTDIINIISLVTGIKCGLFMERDKKIFKTMLDYSKIINTDKIHQQTTMVFGKDVITYKFNINGVFYDGIYDYIKKNTNTEDTFNINKYKDLIEYFELDLREIEKNINLATNDNLKSNILLTIFIVLHLYEKLYTGFDDIKPIDDKIIDDKIREITKQYYGDENGDKPGDTRDIYFKAQIRKILQWINLLTIITLILININENQHSANMILKILCGFFNKTDFEPNTINFDNISEFSTLTQPMKNVIYAFCTYLKNSSLVNKPELAALGISSIFAQFLIFGGQFSALNFSRSKYPEYTITSMLRQLFVAPLTISQKDIDTIKSKSILFNTDDDFSNNTFYHYNTYALNAILLYYLYEPIRLKDDHPFMKNVKHLRYTYFNRNINNILANINELNYNDMYNKAKLVYNNIIKLKDSLSIVSTEKYIKNYFNSFETDTTNTIENTYSEVAIKNVELPSNFIEFMGAYDTPISLAKYLFYIQSINFYTDIPSSVEQKDGILLLIKNHDANLIKDIIGDIKKSVKASFSKKDAIFSIVSYHIGKHFKILKNYIVVNFINTLAYDDMDLINKLDNLSSKLKLFGEDPTQLGEVKDLYLKLFPQGTTFPSIEDTNAEAIQSALNELKELKEQEEQYNTKKLEVIELQKQYMKQLINKLESDAKLKIISDIDKTIKDIKNLSKTYAGLSAYKSLFPPDTSNINILVNVAKALDKILTKYIHKMTTYNVSQFVYGTKTGTPFKIDWIIDYKLSAEPPEILPAEIRPAEILPAEPPSATCYTDGVYRLRNGGESICFNFDIKIIEELIKANANVALKDSDGNTPIYYAIDLLNKDVITQILHDRNKEHLYSKNIYNISPINHILNIFKKLIDDLNWEKLCEYFCYNTFTDLSEKIGSPIRLPTTSNLFRITYFFIEILFSSMVNGIKLYTPLIPTEVLLTKDFLNVYNKDYSNEELEAYCERLRNVKEDFESKVAQLTHVLNQFRDIKEPTPRDIIPHSGLFNNYKKFIDDYFTLPQNMEDNNRLTNIIQILTHIIKYTIIIDLKDIILKVVNDILHNKYGTTDNINLPHDIIKLIQDKTESLVKVNLEIYLNDDDQDKTLKNETIIESILKLILNYTEFNEQSPFYLQIKNNILDTMMIPSYINKCITQLKNMIDNLFTQIIELKNILDIIMIIFEGKADGETRDRREEGERRGERYRRGDGEKAYEEKEDRIGSFINIHRRIVIH